MNINDSGQGQMVGYCDHSNESSGFIKVRPFKNGAK
jgi:hypothetical protein